MSETVPDTTDPLEDLRLPMAVDFDADVMWTYPLTRSGEPPIPADAERARAARYLVDRHVVDPEHDRRHLMLVPTDIVPLPVRVPVGTEVTKLRKTEGWIIRPAVAIAGMVLSALAINGPPAAHAVHNEIERILYQPTPPRDVPIHIPGKTVTISAQVASPDRSGSFAVNHQAIAMLTQRIDAAEAAGDVDTGIFLHAHTSDEYGSNDSISVPSVGNTILGAERLKAVQEAVASAFNEQVPAAIHEAATEHIISKALKGQLEQLAQRDGFANLYDAITAVDAGTHVNPVLHAAIVNDFTKWRGVDLTTTIREPGKTITRTEHIKGIDNPPPGPEGWIPWFVPIPWIRRRERVTEVTDKDGWVFEPGLTVPWPAIMKEDAEHVWVRLLKEAKRDDGSLERFPWAYTRKYLHLFRDGRIPTILRSDYDTPGGASKSIYTLFVDHEPNEEELQIIQSKIPTIAAAQKGRLGDFVTIAVHKSSETGRSPDRPKRVGPGVDKQLGSGVLGVYMPLLGLVEFHIETDDMETLAELLDDFRKSPAVTLDHEAVGHGSSTIHGPLRIKRAFSWRYRNAHVPERGHFDHDYIQLYLMHKALASLADPEAMAKQLDELEFDITYADGDEVRSTRVHARDQLLSVALTAQIVGHHPTQYAGSSDLEYAAETIAAAVGGESVPFDEAGIRETPNGYQPDSAAVQLAAQQLGGREDTYPIEFDDVPAVTFSLMHPFEDPEMEAAIKRACNVKFPRARKMIAILANAAR